MVNDHSNDTLALEIEYNFPNLKALYEREREIIFQFNKFWQNESGRPILF